MAIARAVSLRRPLSRAAERTKTPSTPPTHHQHHRTRHHSHAYDPDDRAPDHPGKPSARGNHIQ